MAESAKFHGSASAQSSRSFAASKAQNSIASRTATAESCKANPMNTSIAAALMSAAQASSVCSGELVEPLQVNGAQYDSRLAQDSCCLGATGELLPSIAASEQGISDAAFQHERQQGSSYQHAFSLSATGEPAIFPFSSAGHETQSEPTSRVSHSLSISGARETACHITK